MSDGAHARKAQLLDRITTSLISANNIDMAAYLGCQDAKDIKTVASYRPEPPVNVQEWLMMIPNWRNQRAAARVVLALARQALPEYEAAMPAKLHTLRSAMRELIVLTEQILLLGKRDPEPDQYKHLVDTIQRLQEEPSLLADQDGLIEQAGRLSMALHAASALTDQWQQAFRYAVNDTIQIWPNGEGMIRDTVRAFLCPWLLGDSDPIKDAPTQAHS